MGQDDFLRRKGSFPEPKSFPCGFCARKSERFLAKTGWRDGRESKLPVHELVEKFLTGCHGEEGEAVNLLPLGLALPLQDSVKNRFSAFSAWPDGGLAFYFIYMKNGVRRSFDDLRRGTRHERMDGQCVLMSSAARIICALSGINWRESGWG